MYFRQPGQLEPKRRPRQNLRTQSAGCFHSPAFESLENRRLLSGVTLITHGFQPFSSDRPGWLDTMADAIVDRAGADTAVYAMRIDRSGPGGAEQVSAFDLLQGLPPSINSNGETVILLDWADASGIVFDYTNTATIAQLTAPFLTNAIPSRGILRPLAESPIHLIGHSRGTSVVTQLAGLLGLQGIWVDQVTTLDPHPVSPDPDAVLFQNVVFADNYFQQDDLTTFGLPVAGSFEADLTFVVPDHTQIHAFYHGTIDTVATHDGDGTAINPVWYTFAVPLTSPRNAVGYHYSRIGGGDRFAGPATAGLHPLFGGSAFRASLDLSNATWPSLIALGVNAPDRNFNIGEAIQPVAFYAELQTGATISFFLDQDANPYSSIESFLGSGFFASTSTFGGVAAPTFSTAGLSPGVYNLYAQITDPTGLTRFLYASGGPITLLDTTPPAVTQLLVRGDTWPVDLLNHLNTTGLGNGGYALPAAANPTVPILPWLGLNQVVVRFSEHVTVATNSLTLHGVNTAALSPTTVNYDPITFTATWTFPQSLGRDKWLVTLDGDVADAFGNPLGSDSQFTFHLLPGDVNRNGIVQSNDVIFVRNAQFQNTETDGYSPMLDVNGSGTIQSTDLILTRNLQFTRLPDGEPISGVAATGFASSASSATEPTQLTQAIPQVQLLLASAAASTASASDAPTEGFGADVSPVAHFVLDDGALAFESRWRKKKTVPVARWA